MSPSNRDWPYEKTVAAGSSSRGPYLRISPLRWDRRRTHARTIAHGTTESINKAINKERSRSEAEKGCVPAEVAALGRVGDIHEISLGEVKAHGLPVHVLLRLRYATARGSVSSPGERCQLDFIFYLKKYDNNLSKISSLEYAKVKR